MSSRYTHRIRAFKVYDAFGTLVGIYRSHSRALRVASQLRASVHA